jgi:integrase
MAAGKKTKKSQVSDAEKMRNRYIQSRYDGRSHLVRMRIQGMSIQRTFKNIEDARAYRDRVQADATMDPTHRLVIQSRQKKEQAAKNTLGVMLEKYAKEVTINKKSAKSEHNRILMILRYDIADLPIELVNRDAILRFIVQIRKRKITDCTLRKYLMVLSALFTTMSKRWGMTVSNPLSVIEMPSNGKSRERRVEPGEVERIIGSVKSSHPIKELLTLSIETACRRGELLNLLWKDVDSDNRIAVLRDTKNTETRVIPLSQVAVNMLSSIKSNKEGLVFSISKHSINSAWIYARKRARAEYEKECLAKNIEPKADYISGLRWHDLRHEGTSRLFEHGLDLMEVASITGHKTLSMLRNYTHLKASNLAQKLDRAAQVEL